MHVVSLDFFSPQLRSQLVTDGVFWNGRAFVLESNRDKGTILTPPTAIAPEWGHTFEGFEVLPREVNIEVAIRHPRLKKYFKFYDFWSEATTLEEWAQIQIEQYPRWKPVDTPVFLKCEELRELLPYWSGPLQLYIRLRLTKPEESWGIPPQWYSQAPPTYIWKGILHSPNGLNPEVSEVKVGFNVLDEGSSYLLKYALPELLRVEPLLYRNVYVPLEDEQDTYFQLDNLDLQKARSPHIVFPGYPPLPLEKQENALILKRYYKVELLRELNDRQTPGTTTQGAPARVSFLYEPKTEPVLFDRGIFQISEVPSIVVSLRQADRTYRLPDEYIRGHKCLYRIQRIRSDLTFEVTAIASSEEELASILEKVRGKCEGDAKIDLTPWGTSSVVAKMSQVTYQPKTGTLETQRSAGFELTIPECPSGTYKKKI